MKRRTLLRSASAAGIIPLSSLALAAPAWSEERSKLKITGVRLVKVRDRDPYPEFTPAAGSWSVTGAEVASPMSIYPKYKATRDLFFAPDVKPFTVEVTTDKGITGLGQGGPGGGPIVTGHLAELLMGRDPFDIERNWDICWRGSMYYGRGGVVFNAISAIDLALWDIIGKALQTPLYNLIGGRTRERIPAYSTGNNIAHHINFGFTKMKLAIAHGPASGREGMRENVKLVERARKALGPDGEIMLDCWMGWTEDYAIEMVRMLEPFRVYWIEEALQPHDYAGFGRLNAQIKSSRIATGEHEYGRYGFRKLLEANGARIWQPDINWCGGLTELRKIGALADAYEIPVIPHRGGLNGTIHWIMANINAPWAELFIPPPGGPKRVYEMFEERHRITRGPEGIYMQPPDEPGWGWPFEVAGPA